MSFGYSVSDVIVLSQLAWRAIEGVRKAHGEQDELTREVTSLHAILQHHREELSNPESVTNCVKDERQAELEDLTAGCEHVLKITDEVLTRSNALRDAKRSGKKLWQKVRVGNGEMKDLAEIRLKISTHTSAITMEPNLLSLGSQGRVENQLSCQRGDLEGIASP